MTLSPISEQMWALHPVLTQPVPVKASGAGLSEAETSAVRVTAGLSAVVFPPQAQATVLISMAIKQNVDGAKRAIFTRFS